MSRSQAKKCRNRASKRPNSRSLNCETLEDRRLLIATTVPYFGAVEFNQFNGEVPCNEADTSCTNSVTALGVGISDGVGGLSPADEAPAFLGFEFDDRLDLGGITDPGPFGGQWGLEGHLEGSGRLGVEYGYYVNAGQAVIDTEGDFVYEFIPQPDGKFALDAQFSTSKKSIKTISPTLSAYADLVIEAQGSVGGEACFYACIDGEKSFNFSQTVPLLSINRQEGSVAPNSNVPPVFDGDIKLLGQSLAGGLDLYGVVNDAQEEIFGIDNEIAELEGEIAKAVTEQAKSEAEANKATSEANKANAEQSRDSQVDSLKSGNSGPDIEIDKPSVGLDVDVSIADKGLLGLQVDVARSLSLGDFGISQDLGSLAVTVPEVNLYAENEGSFSSLYASTTDAGFDRSKNLLAELDLNLGTLLGAQIPFIGAVVGNFNIDLGPSVSASLKTVEYTVDTDLRVEQSVLARPNFGENRIFAAFNTDVVVDPLSAVLSNTVSLSPRLISFPDSGLIDPLLSFPDDPAEIQVAFLTAEEFRVRNELALDVGVDGIFTALEASVEALGKTISVGPVFENTHSIFDYTSPSFSFDDYDVNVFGSTAVQTVALKPDVAVTISDELAAIVDDISFPNSHKKFEFEVRVENVSLNPSTNVSVDVSNLNLTGALTAPGCSFSGTVATCSVGTLAPGASQTFDFSGTTTLSGGDTFDALAVVSSDLDGNASNDQATTDIPVRSSRRFYVGSAGDSSPISGALSDFSCPFSFSTCTLRQAIDAAEDHAGPSIVVIPDTIPLIQLTFGDIELIEPLAIEGAGSDITTIRAKQPSGLFGVGSRIFEISSGPFPWQSDSENEFLIKGVTLRDGKTSAAIGTSPGGAITINGGALTIEDVVFLNNETEDADGGAIRAANSEVTIRDAKFISNQASDRGGAIHIDGGTVSISNAGFTSNSAPLGGALYIESNAVVPIDDAIFTNNFVGAGGAIIESDSLSQSTITADALVTYNNFGSNFGGIVLSSTTNTVNSVSDDTSLLLDPLVVETLNSRNVVSLVALSRDAVLAGAAGAEVGVVTWQLPGRDMSAGTAVIANTTIAHPSFEIVGGVLKLKTGVSLPVGSVSTVGVTGQDAEGQVFTDTVTFTALALPPEMTSSDYTVTRNTASLLFGETISVNWNVLPNVDAYHLTIESNDGTDVRTQIITNESGASVLTTEILGLRHNTEYSVSFDTENAVGMASDNVAPPPFAVPANLTGAIDGDGTVGFADFLTLSSNFGLSVDPLTAGDFDGNGEVDFGDFLKLSGNFGKSSQLFLPPPPAPTTLTTIAAPPSAVRGIVADATSSLITISWDEADNAFGYAVSRDGVTDFNIHFDQFGNSCTAGSAGCTIAVTNLAGDTSITFPAAPDTSYEFEITAINGAGEEVANFRVTTPKLIPTAPQNVTVTELSPTSVQIDWQDSSNEQGYRIVEPSFGTVDDRTVGTAAENATSLVVTDLMPGAFYEFTVIAENDNDAAYSDAVARGFRVSDLGDADDGDYTPGNLTLREAVGLANASTDLNTISFDDALLDFSSTQTILLGSQLAVTNPVGIYGPGADKLEIDANNTGRVLHFSSPIAATYTVNGITLTNGDVGTTDTGGAIKVSDGDDTLIIRKSVVSNSFGNGGGGVSIGGNADYHIIDSALIDNQSKFSGSALLVTGGGEGWIVNSTISGNQSTPPSKGAAPTSQTGPGALFLQTGGTQTGTMRLRNTTVAHNTGVGLQNFTFDPSTATLEVGNSLFANNTGDNAATGGAGAVLTSLGFNVSDDTTLGSPSVTGALLLPLADNGGTTPTHALPSTSGAVDAGSNALAVDGQAQPLTTDQRGGLFGRIVDGDTNGTATVDAGAFEYELLLAGDYNKNGQVEQGDLNLVLLNWGASASPTPQGWMAIAPVGQIDQAELNQVLLNWGNSTFLSPPPIPAPVTDLDAISPAEELAGDANRDGRVSFDDFLLLSSNYGTSGKFWSDGDFTADSRVDFADFLLLSSNFGKSLQATQHIGFVEAAFKPNDVDDVFAVADSFQ